MQKSLAHGRVGDEVGECDRHRGQCRLPWAGAADPAQGDATNRGAERLVARPKEVYDAGTSRSPTNNRFG
jgi:hypothetical protein